MAIYFGLGGITIGGCATASFTPSYDYQLPLGTKLYALYKARRGCLEAVVLKQSRVIKNVKTGNLAVIMYVDTLNGLWGESELGTLGDAQELVAAYRARQNEYLAACLRNCTC